MKEFEVTKEVWGRSLNIQIETQTTPEECAAIVEERVSFINAHKAEFLACLNDEVVYPVVEGINEDVKEKGVCTLPDKTEVVQPITEKQVEDSFVIAYVCLVIDGADVEMYVDLETEPDYLGGHQASIIVDADDSFEFNGING